MTVVAKGRTAPMSEPQYEAWREVLTTFDNWVTIVEGDYRRADKGTPRTVARARLDAFTKARDAVLTVVRREQEKRRDAATDATTAPDATNGTQTRNESSTATDGHSGEITSQAEGGA